MPRPIRRAGNLPVATTSFVGRRGELAELRKKLTGARLVSLVGPGGVGKTRLAVRIATDLGRGFSDGAWLVELADVQDSALVTNAVMAALDLRDQAATEPLALLLSYFRDKELLLVVDNCEHLLGAAAQLVTEVIQAAPDVRVVATSREPLSVSGEHVIPVPPLDLPPAHAAQPLDQLRQNEAVMLFTERAAAASGTFELTASNQAAVVDLCRRLDGLPLAIELAAVRTRVLTVEQIRDRLTDRFGLLTGGSRAALPRHQTLHQQKAPPGPERKRCPKKHDERTRMRCPKKHDERTRIHRVPHNRVRSRGNHLLACRDFNCGGAERVLLEDHIHDEKAKRHQRIPSDLYGQRHMRPGQSDDPAPEQPEIQ